MQQQGAYSISTLNPEPMDFDSDWGSDTFDYMFDYYDEMHSVGGTHVPNPASDRTLEQLQVLSAQVLELKSMFAAERAARMEQQRAFELFQQATGVQLQQVIHEQVCCFTFNII